MGIPKPCGILAANDQRALQERRLTLVCRMLETTNTPIARIGEFCGFNDDLWLKRLFRRRFGMTMREWRCGRV